MGVILDETLWKLARFKIHSGWWQGNEHTVKHVRNTDHLEKYLVPSTGQIADAEKDYNQEKITGNFLALSLIMQ